MITLAISNVNNCNYTNIYTDKFLLKTFQITLIEMNLDIDTYNLANNLIIKLFNNGLEIEEDKFQLNFILSEINFWSNFKRIFGTSKTQIDFEKYIYSTIIAGKLKNKTP